MASLRITELSIARYAIDLVRPFGTPDHPITTREGYVVRLVGEDETEGFGEIAPLRGLHTETLDIVEAWLRAFAPGFLAAENQQLRDAMIISGAPRSVMWGLESAMFSLMARRLGTSPIPSDGQPHELAINALFAGGMTDLEGELERLRPYPAVKVKVGRLTPESDKALLALLVDALPGTRLRIDANRLLDLELAVELMTSIPADRIEYVEDPVSDLDELSRFHEQTGLAIALDETSLQTKAALDADGVTTLVIKPMMRGGVLETMVDAKHARERGQQVVVSSTIESGLGLAFLAQVAAAVQEEGVAAGLGTDALLVDDIVDPPFDSSSGFVSIDDWTGRPSDRFIEQAEWETLGTTT